MDGSSFDRITRRLAVSSSRRGGIATIIAGALGITGVSAVEARRGAGRRHEKLACRNDQTECTTNEQCCSGICRLKPGSGTEYRCVGKRKKREKKDKDNGGNPGPTCLAPSEVCTDTSECCDTVNGFCVPSNAESHCCVFDGQPCEADEDCCGFWGNNGGCATNVCVNNQ